MILQGVRQIKTVRVSLKDILLVITPIWLIWTRGPCLWCQGCQSICGSRCEPSKVFLAPWHTRNHCTQTTLQIYRDVSFSNEFYKSLTELPRRDNVDSGRVFLLCGGARVGGGSCGRWSGTGTPCRRRACLPCATACAASTRSWRRQRSRSERTDKVSYARAPVPCGSEPRAEIPFFACRCHIQTKTEKKNIMELRIKDFVIRNRTTDFTTFGNLCYQLNYCIH